LQQHAASPIAHAEASTDGELSLFVKTELDAFLECGICWIAPGRTQGPTAGMQRRVSLTLC
jgi:hypothetical protein